MLKRIALIMTLIVGIMTTAQAASLSHQSTACFNAIEISSDSSSFEIHLAPTSKSNQHCGISLSNQYPISLSDIAEVSGNTLILHPPHGNTYPDVIALTVFAPQIHRIAAYGPIQITAKQLQTAYLDVDLMDTASLSLSGKQIPLRMLTMRGQTSIRASGINADATSLFLQDDSHAVLLGRIGLEQLVMTGNSRLKAYWVDGKNTRIELHHKAAAFLAGKTDAIDANLFDKSYLDGKFLRAFTGYIATNQRARADVSVQDTLNSQSHDESDIYYYRRPRQNNEYLSSHGAILDMSEIGQHGYPIP